MKSYSRIETIQTVLNWGAALLVIAGAILGLTSLTGDTGLTGIALVAPILGLIVAGILLASLAAIIELLTDIAKK